MFAWWFGHCTDWGVSSQWWGSCCLDFCKVVMPFYTALTSLIIFSTMLLSLYTSIIKGKRSGILYIIKSEAERSFDWLKRSSQSFAPCVQSFAQAMIWPGMVNPYTTTTSPLLWFYWILNRVYEKFMTNHMLNFFLESYFEILNCELEKYIKDV